MTGVMLDGVVLVPMGCADRLAAVSGDEGFSSLCQGAEVMLDGAPVDQRFAWYRRG